MSEPATKANVGLLTVAVILTVCSFHIIGIFYIESQNAKTRRCIVESRNSVEVPEVCK